MEWRSPSEVWSYVGNGGSEASVVSAWEARDLAANVESFFVVATRLERTLGVKRYGSRAQVFHLGETERTPHLAFGGVFC